MDKTVVFPIKSVDSVSDCNPQATLAIFVSVIRLITGDTIRIVHVMDEVILFPIVAIQPATYGSKPQVALAVFGHRLDDVVRYTAGVIGIVLVVDKAVSFRIISVNPTAIRSAIPNLPFFMRLKSPLRG